MFAKRICTTDTNTAAIRNERRQKSIVIRLFCHLLIASSLLHFASISNLDRQYIQIFLLRSFHLCSGTNIEYSSGVQSRRFFESTSPCFHSSWREQQHEAENGMEKHSNIAQKRTIYNYLQLRCDIYRFLYVLD